ncbi:hypothetical protein [Pontibacter sp. SGAir0037]|uniref:hypothetical protein n=1 Tax=Pontibacter sp. SGAir0037 TaxID=2571030 RepID=UPI0010CD1B35|nr:hypothetical protein [Pontibacter sp. SGAir0037]QCR24841.1 hypothetical protein C1N53_02175 [Pontibacter sp. SGAir0037]
MAIFNGSEGGPIPLQEAAAWTANYRKKQDTLAAEAEKPKKYVKAHMFGREWIEKILQQENCVGIRMYYALDEVGTQQLILVGVDENGTDMEDGEIVDRSALCPPTCSSGDLGGGIG